MSGTHDHSIKLLIPVYKITRELVDNRLKIDTPIMRTLSEIYESYPESNEPVGSPSPKNSNNTNQELGTSNDYINKRLLNVMNGLDIPQHVRPNMFLLSKAQKLTMIQQYNRNKNGISTPNVSNVQHGINMKLPKNQEEIKYENNAETEIERNENSMRFQLKMAVAARMSNVLKMTTTLKRHSKVQKVNSRAVFVDLKQFYKIWRCLQSNMLLNSILILSDFDYEWILQPTTTYDININGDYHYILQDNVFRNLLKWKYEQGLLFITNSKNKAQYFGKRFYFKQSFWCRLSNELCCLSDIYKPLILDIKYYQNLSSFKYKPLTINDIQNGLQSQHPINVNVIKEILYRSNPCTLNIYDVENEEYNELNDDEVDQVLDEIDTHWNGVDFK